MTELKNFIVNNKDRDDLVGDICTDLLRDQKFTQLESERTQREYIMMRGTVKVHIRNAVKELFKEYSGEEVHFDDEEDY